MTHSSPRIAAVVPARAGSKGLPGKNRMLLCGKPLLAYSVEAALGCDLITSVWVNSDDPECLRIGEQLGARSYERPAELANDTASMQSVIADFGRHLRESGEDIDAVMVLYPTHPLRTAHDIAQAYRHFVDVGGDRPLIGVKESRTHPYLFYKVDSEGHPSPFTGIDPNNFYRRQDYPEAFELTTFACVLPLGELDTLNAQLQNERTVAMRVEAAKTVDIDTMEDFLLAEMILSSKLGRAAEGELRRSLRPGAEHNDEGPPIAGSRSRPAPAAAAAR